MNNVVKYHNNFNGIGLRNFNSNELNILTKDSKKSPTSISGRWIAFFVKKLKKGYSYDTIFV